MRRTSTLSALFSALVAAVLLVCGCTQAASPQAVPADETGFTDVELPLYSCHDNSPDTVVVRYYENAPHVPYIGVAQYMQLVFGEEVQVEVSGGLVTLTSADGGVAVVDSTADTLTSADWASFRNYLAPMMRGELSGFIDVAAPYVRVASLDYEAPAQETRFDFGSYGIDLHASDEDAYLPLATVADLMADEAMNALSCNGEVLVLSNGFPSNAVDICPDYYDPIYASDTREQDVVDYSYAEICFVFDVLHGNTGVGVIDDAVAESGMDEALQTFSDASRHIRELLLSTSMADYIAGLEGLTYLTMDLHSVVVDTNVASYGSAELMDDMREVLLGLIEEMEAEGYLEKVEESMSIGEEAMAQRYRAWHGEWYLEYGSTAVICLDSFMDYDADGWRAHYEDGAPIPDGSETPDMVGQLIAGLERAKANPEIRNVIIDLSCNTGGSSDVLAGIIAIISGTAELPCQDLVTGQRYTITYDVDTAFDGSFQTDAAYQRYDFNYAILTSEGSFSCGNLLPHLARIAGIPIIGERSGGGSCMVVRMWHVDGQEAQVGSAYSMLIDENGESIEAGVPVDVPLTNQGLDGRTNYSRMYNLQILDDTMNRLYEEELPEAA